MRCEDSLLCFKPAAASSQQAETISQLEGKKKCGHVFGPTCSEQIGMNSKLVAQILIGFHFAGRNECIQQRPKYGVSGYT
jgi:hypothetical protein